MSRIKFRTWMRLGPVSWKEKTPLAVPDEKPWTNVPNLNFDSDNRKIQLNYNWCDNYNSNWAVPSFFRDSPSQTPVSMAGVCFYETDFDHPPSIRPTS